MQDPIVSVITINYNCDQHIVDHINSVLNQTFDSWEHIIVDCASTDLSTQYIKANLHDKLRFYEIGFCGVAEGRNFAIKNARGTICAILDSDDMMMPDRLKWQVDKLISTPGSVAVGGDFIGLIQRKKSILNFFLRSKKYFAMPVDREDIAILLESSISPITHSTLTFKKDLFDQIGGYSLEMEKSEDFDLIIRMHYEGDIYSINKPLSIINFGRPNSHTTRHKPKKRDALYYSIFSVVKNYTIVKQLNFGREQIEEKLDKFEISSLGILQLKWYIYNVRHLKHNDLFFHYKLIGWKILYFVFKKGSLKSYLNFPATKDKLLGTPNSINHEI